MRVRMGKAGGPPVQMVQEGADGVLYVRPNVVMSADVIARLDAMLRHFVPETRQAHYNYTEAALKLGVSEYWLRTRVGKGEIPHRRVGTYVRFTDEDLDEIRDSLRRGPPT